MNSVKKFNTRRLGILLAGALTIASLGGCSGAVGSADTDTVKDMKKKYTSMVKLGTYDGVEYTPTDTTVTDEMVQAQLDSLVKSKTTKEHITDEIAKINDTVNIDYVGSIDGVEFDGGSTQGQGTEIVLGNSGYIDNFDYQIAGHKPGETFDVNVTFPDEYTPNPDLAGKPAVFKTTLNYIIGNDIVPELTDDFINEATSGEFTTVDSYRTHVREDLETQSKESGLATDKHTILQSVIDGTTVIEFPEQELETRVNDILGQYESIAAANNVDVGTLLSYYYGFDAETFKSQVKTAVETYMREKMVVVALADELKITATEEEYKAKTNELLSQSGLSDVSELSKQYGYTEDDYYLIVLEEKVVDYLYEHAKIVEATTSDASTDDTTEAASDEATEATSDEAVTETSSDDTTDTTESSSDEAETTEAETDTQSAE